VPGFAPAKAEMALWTSPWARAEATGARAATATSAARSARPEGPP